MSPEVPAPHLTSAERQICDDIDAGLIERLTCALVEAPSENPGGSEAAAAAVLAGAAADLGLVAETDEVAPGRPNVTATWLPGEPNPPATKSAGHKLAFSRARRFAAPVYPGETLRLVSRERPRWGRSS